jgi:cation diffusion facilitator family transporter
MGFNQWLLERASFGKEPSRKFIGYLEAWISIVGNIFLFAFKFYFGLWLNSIALVADAFHSLSDVLTSIVVLIGFKIGAMPPDKEHPFGHGRVEQIASLVIAMLLLVVAFDMGKISFERLISPQVVKSSSWVVFFLILSAVFKEWMARFSAFLGKKINSQSLIADAWHHRSDAIATALVAAGLVLAGFGILRVDGLFGVGVSLLLLWVVYDLTKSSSSFLLGEAPAKEVEGLIEKTVSSLPNILDYHDLHVHDYQNHKVISLHIVVKKGLSVDKAHAIADAAEKKIKETLSQASEVTIHIDPLGSQ